MPRSFWRATAEAVVTSVDATYVALAQVDIAYVADFAQLTIANATASLALAVDLRLLEEDAGCYTVSSPLCRAFVTPDLQRKATALRVTLEDYEPFIRFRERLMATGDATLAAKQVKQLMDLSTDHEETRETLLSLGQYSQALVAEGGGAYRARENADTYDLEALAQGCATDAAAEQLIRSRLGSRALTKVSREEVVVPLADALKAARAGDGRGAVVCAGNAVESYLAALGVRSSVNLVGKTGLNAKAQELATQGHLPTKLVNIGRYLGHIRNAADHGTDVDINAPWDIREATGLEYVFVACSFIAATTERELGGPPEL